MEKGQINLTQLNKKKRQYTSSKDLTCLRKKGVSMENIFIAMLRHFAGKTMPPVEFLDEYSLVNLHEGQDVLLYQAYGIYGGIPTVKIYFNDKKVYEELRNVLREQNLIR